MTNPTPPIKKPQPSKNDIKKAFARAETFWTIIGKAGISLSLGNKIGDVPFDKLDDSEKLTLVKVSTLLIRENHEIEKQFAEIERAEIEKLQKEKDAQVKVDGIATEAQETPQTPEVSETNHAQETGETAETPQTPETPA